MAGRPKRRARLAAQWAEVDRAAGVKVPRAKRKKNGGLPAGWRLYGGGPFKRRFFYGEYTLVCLRPERGRHLYATFSGGDNPSEWAWLADYRLASEVADGSLGVEVDFDKAPTSIQTALAEVLATVGLVSVPANRRTPNAPFPDPRAKARKYEVVVGELGTLYSSPSRTAAEMWFGNLARASDSHAMGLLAGSDVRLCCDGVVLAEHIGRLNSRHRGR